MRRVGPGAVAAAVLVVCVAQLAGGCAEPVDTASPEPRLVSLAPHLTELAYSAGAGQHLVGAIEYSDYPPEALGLPRVGDAFGIDVARVVALAPTHVLAWGGGNPAPALNELRARGINVIEFTTADLSSVATHVRQLGALAGEPQVADAAATQYEVGLARLRARYADALPVSVFVQVGGQPLYTVTQASVTGQLVAACGGRNVFADLAGLSAPVSVESVVAADPQVILTTGDLATLTRWVRFGGRAVTTGQLNTIDADLTSRASLRLLEGARAMCAALDGARQAPQTR